VHCRLSNDSSLPDHLKRNYKGVGDAFVRIFREEGVRAFFSGSGPFVNRAMVVGAVQVGTYDQFRDMFRKNGVKNVSGPSMLHLRPLYFSQELLNVFYASMVSGLIFATVTAPLETAKNRMAFQRADPVTGAKLYRSTMQTMSTVVAKEGALALWSGFPPYYLRCGGQTVFMFIAMEYFRGAYRKMYSK
jgi:solute carrier family 25 (mitochondrial oxoglutarate transporter), member 11